MQKEKGPLNAFVAIAACGAIGGGINAFLCYAHIPVPIPDIPDFPWQVVPGGALHGAVLALIPVVTAFLVGKRQSLLPYFLLPILGWIAGFLSWIPLDHWAAGESWGEALLWPFSKDWSDGWTAVAWKPFQFFGLVSFIYFLCLCLAGVKRPLQWHAAYAVCAGLFGALWFWTEMTLWYFALIHGAIWGVLVGFGTHRAARSYLLPQTHSAA